jgi:hypothetical protein
VAGLRAAIDPVTGQFRELEPAEAAALDDTARVERRESFAAAGAATTTVVGRHGGVGVRLGPEHMTALVATIGPDGRLRYDHAAGPNPTLPRSATATRPGEEVRDDR